MLKAEIASLRAQYNLSCVPPCQIRNIYALRLELSSLRAAAEEEREAIRREQEVLKATIRTLRGERNLTHILPSVRDNIPSMRTELSSLLDEIDRDKQDQHQRTMLKAEIRTLRSENDLSHIRPTFRDDVTSLTAEYDTLCSVVRAQRVTLEKKREEEKQIQAKEAEKAELLGRITELRNSYQVSHVKQHLSDDVDSLTTELKLVLSAVAEIERQRNRSLSDKLSDYNTWNPFTVVAATGAALVAAPVVGPYVIGAAALGVAGVAARTAGQVVHSNNARAVAELGYKERREALQLESARSSYPVIEYPD